MSKKKSTLKYWDVLYAANYRRSTDREVVGMRVLARRFTSTQLDYRFYGSLEHPNELVFVIPREKVESIQMLAHLEQKAKPKSKEQRGESDD